MDTSIFLTIPSYNESDLPRTIDSAIRSSSGQHLLHISVVEQVTRYAEAYMLGRVLDEHVQLDIGLVATNTLLGVGGARHLAERRFADEGIQVQIDAHVRFEADWDVAVVQLVERMGDEAIISSVAGDPWTHSDCDCVPVVLLDRMEDGQTLGKTETLSSGDLVDQPYPSRTVLPCGVVGASWCDEVPADPHILYYGEWDSMAARLWTHGRTLWTGRLPWYSAHAGTRNRDYMSHADWAKRDADSKRRVKALLTGAALDADDPAGENLDRYGLGAAYTLDDWMEYSGFDFRAETVRTPWP